MLALDPHGRCDGMADELSLCPHSMLHDSGNWGATCKQRNKNVGSEESDMVCLHCQALDAVPHYWQDPWTVQHHMDSNGRASRCSAWSTQVWQTPQLLRVAPAALRERIQSCSQSLIAGKSTACPARIWHNLTAEEYVRHRCVHRYLSWQIPPFEGDPACATPIYVLSP